MSLFLSRCNLGIFLLIFYFIFYFVFSVEQLSRSSTPPVASAIERFSNTNRNESVMIESNDSILGRDYVVVEKRTVEINALADGE